MQRLFAIFACLVLSGCVMPPIVNFASVALDVVSFMATGKSVSDHALSAVVDEDCAVFRAVTEQNVEAVCQAYASEEERQAAIAPAVTSAFKTVFVEPDKVPPGIDDAPLPVALMDGIGESAARDERGENQPAIYLMIGNFPSLGGAEKLAARVTGISTVVAPAMAGDNRYFRVAAGPITAGETDAAQARLVSVGINHSWTASLCPRDLGAPPCDNP